MPWIPTGEGGKRARRAMISCVTCMPSALAAFSRRTTSPCSLTRLSNVSLDVSSAIASSTARGISGLRFRAFRSPACYFIATENESRRAARAIPQIPTDAAPYCGTLHSREARPWARLDSQNGLTPLIARYTFCTQLT